MSYSDEEDDDLHSSNSSESYYSDEEDEDDEDNNPEMVTLNLAFGNKSDTIQVHWNDDPEDLAKMFVKKHGLKATSTNRIRDHISEVIKQYKIENSELRPQSPTLDQSFDDDDDQVERTIRDRYRPPNDGNKSFEPLDLPQRNPEKPPQTIATTPRRELRLSDSTAGMASSRTISTVTNPEYEQPLPLPLSRTNPDNQIDNNDDDNSDNDVSNQQRNVHSTTDIARILSKTLSQNYDDEADQAQATQYLDSILRGSGEINRSSQNSHGKVETSQHEKKTEIDRSSAERTHSHPPPPVTHHHPHSYHPHSHHHSQHQHPQQQQQRPLTEVIPKEEQNHNDYGEGGDHETSNDHESDNGDEQFDDEGHLDDHNDLNPDPEVGDEVPSEISDNTEGDYDDESILDISNSFEQSHFVDHQQANASMYDRIKSNWDMGKKKGVKTLNNTTSNSTNPITTTPKARNTIIFSKSPSTSIPTSRSTNPIADRTADRLLHYGETIEKRKEWKRNQLLKEEKEDIESNQFKLSRKSRQVTSHISYANKSSNVNERLYEEGVKKLNKKKKEVKERDEEIKGEVISWSCIHCGTFHELDYTARKNIATGILQQKCSSCGVEKTQDILPFQPTNIAPLQSERIENRISKGEGIHKHLYENSSQQAKRVNLLQKAWGENDHENTFCPVVPKASKDLLERRKVKGKNITVRSLSSCSSSGRIPTNQKMPNKDQQTVAQLKLNEYLSLPVSERLSLGETLCRQGIALENDSTKDSKSDHDFFSRQSTNSPRKPKDINETVKRLTYEYVEKEAKRQAAEEELKTYDPKTKKKYFNPTIPSSSLRRVTPVIITKEEPIYERLLRRGDEHKKSIEQLKETLESNEKHRLEMKKHRSLARSLTILQDSFQQGNEEIFKILLAHQLIEKKENESGQISPRKLMVEKLANESKEMLDWQTHSLDVQTIDPSLLSKDIRDVIAAVKEEVIKRSQQQGEKKQKDRVSKESLENTSIDFDTFQNLIEHVLKRKRDGPGKSYLVVPKPRGEVTKALIEQEKSEISFHPTLDKHSIALAKRRGRTADKSIAEILTNEGEYSKKQAQKVKERVESELLKECSFKPQLIPPPRNVIPTYRGQPKTRSSKHSMSESNLSSINHSHQTPSILSTTPFGESIQFTPTGLSNSSSTSTHPQPITISRLSQSNIAKALLSYDRNDDHHDLAPSESDKFTEYNESTEEVNSLPSCGLSPLMKTRKPVKIQGNYYPQHSYVRHHEDDEEEQEKEIHQTLSPPPPPFSILTSSFTMSDLQEVHQPPPPPPPPPSSKPSTASSSSAVETGVTATTATTTATTSASSNSAPLYRYSSFGDIDSTIQSPHQQSVIQRLAVARSSKDV